MAQRHVVTHDGRAVYEWDQTLEEVNAYVPAPPGVRACHVQCEFASTSLRLGLAANPPYMQASLWHADTTRRALMRSCFGAGRSAARRQDIRVLLDARRVACLPCNCAA